MYKSLIIHHNNVPDLTIFDYQESFNNNGNLDSYIHNTIVTSIKKHDFDIVYIKDNLSSNYLEFYGLTMAYHIRLSLELSEKQRYTPIVILTDLDANILNKLSSISRIIFTPNIFIAPNNIKSIDFVQYIKEDSSFSDENKREFLENIQVKPPRDNHHNITNEWAIDQWSYVLDINPNSIQKNRKKISSMLYYKYIRSKYHLENKSKNSNIKPKKIEGKILLIDDKYSDGWEDILKSFSDKYYQNVDFDVVRSIEKDSTVENIQESIDNNYYNVADNNYSPDVIILDLRLIEADNNIDYSLHESENKKSINRISGLQVLKHIKTISPATQVIIFTASSDSLIVDELYNHDILGYVKKDSPLDRYKVSKNSFSKLDKLIKLGFSKKYLKDIYRIQKSTLELNILKNAKLVFGEGNHTISIKNTVPQVFDILNSNLPKPFLYAMYSIFKCIEYINDNYFREQKINDKWRAVWKNSNSSETIIGYSTEDRISAIIKQKLQMQEDKEWILNSIHEIVCSRNYNIHGGEEKSNCKDGLIKLPTEKHIENWFNMLYIILEHMDKTTNE